MKKIGKALLFLTGVFLVLQNILAPVAQAQFYPVPGTPMTTPYVTPMPCRSGQGSQTPGQYQGSYCPDLPRADTNYQQNQDANNNYDKSCAANYEEWLADKTRNFWVEDPEVTALGKGGERSRQFLLWVLEHPSLDTSPQIL